jgi:hypothetical protein
VSFNDVDCQENMNLMRQLHVKVDSENVTECAIDSLMTLTEQADVEVFMLWTCIEEVPSSNLRC